MRSLLFVPGDDAKKLGKAVGCGADVVILDLEDSVAAGRKALAREMVVDFLKTDAGRDGAPKIAVRLNPMSGPTFFEDIAAFTHVLPWAFVLPKTVHGDDIGRFNETLARPPAEWPKLIAIATETAASLFTLGSYAGAGDNLVGMAWGAEDLSASLGAIAARDETGAYTDAFRLARTLTLAGASAAHCTAIDTVYVDFRDMKGLETETHAARRDGFTAKLAIHPAQIEVINRVFAPTEAEIERAQAVVRGFAEAPEAGVLSIGGEMVDRPHLLRARITLERAGILNDILP